jgi:hypothetical protein
MSRAIPKTRCTLTVDDRLFGLREGLLAVSGGAIGRGTVLLAIEAAAPVRRAIAAA